MKIDTRKHSLAALLVSLTAAFLLLTAVIQPAAGGRPAGGRPTATSFGYGFNVAELNLPLLESMGFNWLKLFLPPGTRFPVNVLMRVDAHAGHLNDLAAFGASLHQLAQDQAPYVEAYEIGNEPNLDASYGWTVAPNAADYATLLCVAYNNIKAADPEAIVVSAGLAPTGRVQGNWNGHPGHNGLYQDEREFLLEFIAAGGGACLDAVGYHPYGFSADYDAEPDVPSADPTQNCANGFCFRGSEKLYELMQANGLGQKKVWATEFGWIVTPPDHCLSDPSWQGRLWQIVSPDKQANNLVGAYQYAAAHWPWMEAMFIFNLNFNTAAWYPECEQMRFYGVEGHPAEQALRDMPKVTAAGQLQVSPNNVTLVITVDDQPYDQTICLQFRNTGEQLLTYTITLEPGTLDDLTLSDTDGTLEGNEAAEVELTISSDGRATGVYSAALTITATAGTVDVSTTIPITLHIFDEIHPVYLPAVLRP